MTFRQQLLVDSAIFINPDEWAEDVTYNPQGGTPIACKAVIRRLPPDTSRQDRDNTVQRRAEVWLRHDALNVAGPASILKGGDTVSFPEIVGGTPAVPFRVLDIGHRDDPAIWKLLVGR